MTSIRDAETGSASIELAVLTPVVLLMFTLMIAGGRLVNAHSALDTATNAAARAASLTRTAPAAHTAADRVTDHTLTQHHLHCTDRQLDLDTSGFNAALGEPGSVTLHTHCSVPLAELTLPGLPGSVPLASEFASPTDPYRERA